jgi:hypothetical protein
MHHRIERHTRAEALSVHPVRWHELLSQSPPAATGTISSLREAACGLVHPVAPKHIHGARARKIALAPWKRVTARRTVSSDERQVRPKGNGAPEAVSVD